MLQPLFWSCAPCNANYLVRICSSIGVEFCQSMNALPVSPILSKRMDLAQKSVNLNTLKWPQLRIYRNPHEKMLCILEGPPNCVYIFLKQTEAFITAPFSFAKNTSNNWMTSVTFSDDEQTSSPIRAKVENANRKIAAYNFWSYLSVCACGKLSRIWIKLSCVIECQKYFLTYMLLQLNFE